MAPVSVKVQDLSKKEVVENGALSPLAAPTITNYKSTDYFVARGCLVNTKSFNFESRIWV